MSRIPIAALALSAALVLAVPALADGSFRLDVRSDDGESLRLEIPSSWARAFLSVMDVECEPSDDPAVVRAMQALDREGDGGSVRFVDHDGDRVHARRDGDSLRLHVVDPDDEEKADIELSWRAAECWMLGRPPADGLRFEGRESDFRFELIADDARIHVSID